MSLLDPNVGELADRISILALKIASAKKKDLGCKHFEEELSLCKKTSNLRVAGLSFDGQARYQMIEAKLSMVNANLWAVEDRIRQAIRSKESEKVIADCATKIVSLNDERMMLIQGMNALFGKCEIEKIYS